MKRVIIALALLLGATVAAPAPQAQAANLAAVNQWCTANNGYPNDSAGRWDWMHTYIYTRNTWCVSDHQRNSRLVWQADCNLVMYSGWERGGVALWASGTKCAVNQNYQWALVFQNDGNLTIRAKYTNSPSGQLGPAAIWQTGVARAPRGNGSCHGYTFGMAWITDERTGRQPVRAYKEARFDACRNVITKRVIDWTSPPRA